MVCDICCRKQSSFSIRFSNLSFNLCFDCAKKYDCLSLGKKSPKELENQFEILSAEAQKMKRACPVCGTKASDVIVNHKVGCSECFNYFLTEISEYFESIGVNVSSNEYFNEKTLEKTKKEIIRNTIFSLEQKIKHSVECEDFESAATYRDKINELKKMLGDEN